MFFIHGGAFYMGTYLGMGPKELLEKDIVLVEIQYRLGPLGFMCLDHDDAAGNMGMLDQVISTAFIFLIGENSLSFSPCPSLFHSHTHVCVFIESQIQNYSCRSCLLNFYFHSTSRLLLLNG